MTDLNQPPIDASKKDTLSDAEIESLLKEEEDENKEQYMFHYATDKAGMGNIQKEEKQKIATTIEDITKNSKYYERQKEIYAQYEKQIQQMKTKLERLKQIPENYKAAAAKAEQLISKIKASRILERVWLHVDMDMFFAAVEILDNPTLKDKPIAVGGEKMLSTSNYIARKYGIRSGMPSFIAKKLCPELVIVRCNFKRYKEVSKLMKEILVEYDKNFESYGLDEANLDITDYLIEHKILNEEGKEKVVKEIRARILEKTKLTASCGVACNKMLAKICANINKPDNYLMLKSTEADILNFLNDLEIRKVPYIGKKTQQFLNGVGIFKCKDIIEKAADLFLMFDESQNEFFIESALGVNRCYHDLESMNAPQKSISISRTYDKNLYQIHEFVEKLEDLCTMLEERVTKQDVSGKLFSIEIKTSDFKVIQKSRLVHYYINKHIQFMQLSQDLLKSLWPCKPTRLLGVRLGNLTQNSEIHDDERVLGNIAQFAKKLSKDDIETQRKKVSEELKKENQTSGEAGSKKRKAPLPDRQQKKLRITKQAVTLDQFFKVKEKDVIQNVKM